MPTENDEKLTKVEAIEFLEEETKEFVKIDSKIFENYYKSAEEFLPLPRSKGERYYFSKRVFEETNGNK